VCRDLGGPEPARLAGGFFDYVAWLDRRRQEGSALGAKASGSRAGGRRRGALGGPRSWSPSWLPFLRWHQPSEWPSNRFPNPALIDTVDSPGVPSRRPHDRISPGARGKERPPTISCCAQPPPGRDTACGPRWWVSGTWARRRRWGGGGGLGVPRGQPGPARWLAFTMAKDGWVGDG